MGDETWILGGGGQRDEKTTAVNVTEEDKA